jgi:light-regulated signal transduction histidine kinase (bacteriophytochrome)
MNDHQRAQTLTPLDFDISKEPIPSDPAANPFKLVVDPAMRLRLRRAIFELIESHDQELARYVAEGSLALDSYKEYIELFAHSLKQTMSSREGIAYLLQACGFEMNKDEINLQPETRWKVQR